MSNLRLQQSFGHKTHHPTKTNPNVGPETSCGYSLGFSKPFRVYFCDSWNGLGKVLLSPPCCALNAGQRRRRRRTKSGREGKAGCRDSATILFCSGPRPAGEVCSGAKALRGRARIFRRGNGWVKMSGIVRCITLKPDVGKTRWGVTTNREKKPYVIPVSIFLDLFHHHNITVIIYISCTQCVDSSRACVSRHLFPWPHIWFDINNPSFHRFAKCFLQSLWHSDGGSSSFLYVLSS